MKLLKLFLVALFISSCNTAVTQNKSVLTKLRTFELPGVKGRIDHLSIDLKSNRLFVAALGNGTVEVINLNDGKDVHTIKDLREPQGVEYVAQSSLLFVTCAGDGKCRIFDASNFKLLNQIQFESDADNIRYDNNKKIVYVGFGTGGIAAIDALTMKLLYKINLPAHPEAFQIDEKTGRMFVNVPGAGQLIVSDLNKKAVITKINLKQRDNFPMALDTVNRVIFIGTWDPPKLLLFDLKSLKLISEKNISQDADDIYYDKADSLIFVSCGSGYIDIFKQINQKKIILKEKIKTLPGARTSLFVPELNKLFIAARNYNGQNAKIIEYSVNR